MFNDGFKDHQIEHRGVDDQLWLNVQRVVRQQNERAAGGFAFEQGEQTIDSPTSGLPSQDRVILSLGARAAGVISPTF